MKRGSHLLGGILLLAAGCHKTAQTTATDNSEQTADVKGDAKEEVCDPDPAWLPTTKKPIPDRIEDSEPDCSFYKASYGEFLFATQPGPQGPAFLAKPYSTVADLFGPSSTPLVPAQRMQLLSLTPRTPEQPHSVALNATTLGSGIRQAGHLQGILIDRNGHPIFYSIHVNDAFADFIRDPAHPVTTAAQLTSLDKNVRFDGKVVEMKAAWMIVDPKMAQGDYLTTQAIVPHLLSTPNGDVSLDASNPSKPVTVALIALHVAFARPNHPELIWASFEHVDDNGNSDLAPAAEQNPADIGGATLTRLDRHYLLFADGSTVAQSNNGRKRPAFNEATQSFSGTTPIYRVYPNSKVGDGSDEPDGAVVSLNRRVRLAFEKVKPVTDARYHYRLVGAVWLKHPEPIANNPQSGFIPGSAFANGETQTSDDPKARLSGEGAMSSMAMESFTQQTFPNCFGCHDTQAIQNDPRTPNPLVEAKLLNVSHIMAKFLAEQPAPAAAKSN